jgi:hypothetical protein
MYRKETVDRGVNNAGGSGAHCTQGQKDDVTPAMALHTALSTASGAQEGEQISGHSFKIWFYDKPALFWDTRQNERPLFFPSSILKTHVGTLMN